MQAIRFTAANYVRGKDGRRVGDVKGHTFGIRTEGERTRGRGGTEGSAKDRERTKGRWDEEGERDPCIRIYATCERVRVERGNALTARNRICRGPSFHPV